MYKHVYTLRNIILIIHSNTIAYKVTIAYGMRKKHPTYYYLLLNPREEEIGSPHTNKN
jgi:hypothetical protein